MGENTPENVKIEKIEADNFTKCSKCATRNVVLHSLHRRNLELVDEILELSRNIDIYKEKAKKWKKRAKTAEKQGKIEKK